MTTLTVLADQTRTVQGELRDGAARVAETDLAAAVGWELKPEGLCRGDVCVPVRERARLGPAGRLDLAAVGRALDRPVAVAADSAVVAVGEPRGAERATLDGRAAPFTFPDLDGRPRSLEEWRGRKKLLVVFASW